MFGIQYNTKDALGTYLKFNLNYSHPNTYAKYLGLLLIVLLCYRQPIHPENRGIATGKAEDVRIEEKNPNYAPSYSLNFHSISK